jgi:hypothetical protein
MSAIQFQSSLITKEAMSATPATPSALAWFQARRWPIKRAEKDCRSKILRGDFHKAGPEVS